MGVVGIVILILGILILIEGLIVVIFPNWAKKVGRNMLKSKKKLKKAGIIEIIVAIILILIGINV